jgi:hypothetical protein
MRLFQIILVNNLIPTWRLIYIICFYNTRLDKAWFLCPHHNWSTFSCTVARRSGLTKFKFCCIPKACFAYRCFFRAIVSTGTPDLVLVLKATILADGRQRGRLIFSNWAFEHGRRVSRAGYGSTHGRCFPRYGSDMELHHTPRMRHCRLYSCRRN